MAFESRFLYFSDLKFDVVFHIVEVIQAGVWTATLCVDSDFRLLFWDCVVGGLMGIAIK
jgi:hypothetical protein